MDEEKALVYDPKHGKQVEKTSNDLILDGADSLDNLLIEQTVFLVDVSYSMNSPLDDVRESKLAMLRKVMSRFIEKEFNQNEFTRFGLVKFSTSTEILVEITDCKEELLDAVDMLYPESSTQMHTGLETTLQLLIEEQRAGWIPRIVLISDGRPDSQDAVTDVIYRYREMSVVIDAIYLGPQSGAYNEEDYKRFMKKLAEVTGGKFIHIWSSAEFERMFLQAAEHKALPAANLGRILEE